MEGTKPYTSRALELSVDDHVFVLTGAGVSAESGIPTFRGSGGLWRNYRIEEVASPEAWRRDPGLVWEFYSMRRKVAAASKPNPAHVALAHLGQRLGNRLFLCAQMSTTCMSRQGPRTSFTCMESCSRADATVVDTQHSMTRLCTKQRSSYRDVPVVDASARIFAGLVKRRSI